MHPGALRALEFDRIVTVVTGLAVTPTGQAGWPSSTHRSTQRASSPCSARRRRAPGSSPTIRAFRCARRRISTRSSTRSASKAGRSSRCGCWGSAGYLESIEQSRQAIARVGAAFPLLRAAGRNGRVVQAGDRRRPPEDRAVRRGRGQRKPGPGLDSRTPAQTEAASAHDARRRFFAVARRRSICRSRWSPTATAATC